MAGFEVIPEAILGKLMDVDFDMRGITVCSVGGTNFLPYVRFLGPNGLKTPFAVVTDRDPQDAGGSLGETRVQKLVAEMLKPEEYKSASKEELLKLAPKKGLFVGDYTFEVDLFRCGRRISMCKTLMELSDNAEAKKRAAVWFKKPAEMEPEQLLKDITAIGKGRFAQRLASRISKDICPQYMRDAITYVAERCH